MFADYHVHTEFSHDSSYPLEAVVRDAAAAGLEEICITDHVDYGILPDWEGLEDIPYVHGKPFVNVDYPRYAREVARVAEVWSDRIAVRFGMEFGLQTHTIPLYRKLFAKYPFDFIILSIHEIEDRLLFTGDFQKGRTRSEINERYYQELLDVVKAYTDYSVLGHLDLICRYDPDGPYPFANVREYIAEILRVVIEDGKGIELNTSTHRYGLSNTMPSRHILELYRDLGGEILTVGSDSHAPGCVGGYIRDGQEYLQELGFKNICTFKNMAPVFHSL